MKNKKNSPVEDFKFDTVKIPRNNKRVKVVLLSILFAILVLGGYNAIKFTYNYFHSHTYINGKVTFKVELPKMVSNDDYKAQLEKEKEVEELSKKALELLQKEMSKKDSSFNLVKPVQAVDRYCNDPISYIRCSGEDLGKSNKDIMTMIRIAQKESGMNAKSKNKNSSASGLFQIIAGTWYSNDCIGDKFNFKDNTDCAWKIQSGAGYKAWEVCNNGLANCF